MNKYDLFDAFGGIDNDLLQRSEDQKTTRRIPFRKALIAAAAVIALAVTAIAAPAIMELLYDGAVEQSVCGTTLAALDGSMIEYNDIYMIHFNVENTEGLPTTIEEYNIPHYAVENGWTLDGGYLYTYEFGETTNIRLVKEDVPDAWVEFEQATINQFADWVNQEPGTNQFYISAPQGSTVTPTSISTSFGEIEGYISPAESDLNVPYDSRRRLHVFWRSGDYAYHTITSDTIDPDLLAQIIQSIGPVDDPAPYLVDNGRTVLNLLEPNPDLHDPVTLTDLPSDYKLGKCTANDYSEGWHWFKDNDNHIQFIQYTDNRMDLYLHQYTLNQIPHTLDTLEMDGSVVYFITTDDRIAAYWAGTECEYALSWTSEEVHTWEQMEALIRSLEPVDDISAYVTN